MTMTALDALTALNDEAGTVNEHVWTATLLVYVAHSTRNRDVWGGDRAITYWSILPDRVRTCCYAGPTLAAWWERICRVLDCAQPYRKEDRLAVAQALAAGDDGAVLEVLRTQAEMVCLRARLATQISRDNKETIT